MRTIDTIVFSMNGISALVAFFVNVWASRLDDPRRRPLRVAIAAMAALYVAGYGWVIITKDVAAWSTLYRGISILVWPLVWCAPAIYGVVLHRRDRRVLIDHEVRES